MLNKSQLAWKNVKTTIEREPVYFFTMVLIAGLMFAFDSMLFSKDVQTICEQGFIMDVLIGMMTVFIVLVTSWFVSYMMQQSFKMRSKEFGLYMLFGIKRKEITRNFQKETLLLAGIAYGIGIVVGVLLKQFLMVIFYDMFRLEYIIEMEFHFGAVVLTALIYFSCYIVAFIKVKKQISNMTILEFSKLKQKNEETKIEKKQLKLRKTSNWLLKGNRLFVWRTIQSEIQSMRKMLFFVTLLLMISILGSTIAMMYTDYQNNQIDSEYPFDLMIYHQSPKLDFKKEKEILKNTVGIKSSNEYQIYQNGSSFMNEWLYTHLQYFGDLLINKNGTFDKSKLEQESDYDVYYKYDTYMKLSDYNALLKMLGEKQVTLSDNEYLLQIKRRLKNELSNDIQTRMISCGKKDLHCKQISTIDFEQNGHNGADYIFVVPDKIANEMKPYFSVMTVNTKKPVSEEISIKLDEVIGDTEPFRYGSNHSILYTSPILAKKEIEITLKSTITAVLFPFAYVSLVFLCVAISVLSAHLISNANENRKRYDLLEKMGVTKSKIDTIIHKQLSIDYLIPLSVAFIPACLMAHNISKQFILDTGLRTHFGKYISFSLLWILVIYFIYFIMTDIFFRRNIHYKKK